MFVKLYLCLSCHIMLLLACKKTDRIRVWVMGEMIGKVWWLHRDIFPPWYINEGGLGRFSDYKISKVSLSLKFGE